MTMYEVGICIWFNRLVDERTILEYDKLTLVNEVVSSINLILEMKPT